MISSFSIPGIIMLCIVVALIILFIISFTLFIRRLLNNISVTSNQSDQMEKKLDRIIELLEENKGR
ncbi:DUF4083 domain-containing protein [Gracilibacillus xinjiangensis]|uniref:DUF4083 domain-containing protein n=1 Tax=Gracilibacillus xinjiangensis TaxID=1193282 RepID=A0ABV8X0I1_9BACI